MNNKEALIEKISNKEVIVSVIGLGYVGLPLVLRLVDEGLSVIGIDIDEKKAELLNLGKSYIETIPGENVKEAVEKGFYATTEFSDVSKSDFIILCVPTPLDAHREPDLSYVIKTTEDILPFLKSGQAISLESTTYPGTTEEELLPRLESTGLTVGNELFLIYSPEREDPGNEKYSTKTIPKVVGGVTENCLSIGNALYGTIIDKVVPVSSTKAAELTKLLENIHRAVNIGLINELKIVADKMNVDIYEVIDAAATKPFGFTPYYPGPGLGGHCIPIDPFYLTWKAREYGVNTRFIELAGEVNTAMPEWVVSKVTEALNSQKKAINGSRVLILGLAYKKNVDDTRESPSVELIELLAKKGAMVDYSDPHVPSFPKMRKYNFDLESVDINPISLKSYDLVLVSTNHDKFDYEVILDNSELIVDARGVYRSNSSKLFRA